MRRRLAGLPLRVKLVASVLLIALAGLTLAGVATLTQLHSYLISRVDAELASDPGQFSGLMGPRGNVAPGGKASSQPPSAIWFGVYTSTGSRAGQIPASRLGGEAPPALTSLRNLPADELAGTPFTVAAVSGSGTWRVALSPATLPDGTSGFVATGRSLDDVNYTVAHLLLLEVAIGVAVLVLMGGAGYLVVRRSLRPLSEVESTAAAIAAGDLSSRVPPADERTEVGRLAAALNGMLTQIETAFARQSDSERQARVSEDRMRRFVSDASHELRTPLTSIRGFAELYRMGAASEVTEIRRLMQRIESEAARMGVLVEDLLLLARLDESRPVEHESVDLATVLADAGHDAGLMAPDRDITLELPDAPVTVIGDDARLRQIVQNLVGNALTHTPPGTAVSLRLSEQDGAAVVEVADHGPGIEPEHAAHVFERFYRTDAARTRAAGGSGLGLAIVAELVAAHDGEVSVASEPGEGATFVVRLPVAHGVPAGAAQPPVSAGGHHG